METFELKLGKPLCFFDIESTGIDVGRDRIVEIAILKVFPDGHTERYLRRVNPEMPIPPQASAVHHIYDADVVLEPTFKALAPEILKFIGNSDLAGYNSNHFDVPLLVEEFLRAEVDFDVKGRRLIDVQTIFHRMEPRTLSGACRFYLDKRLEGAHGAMADTEATFEVFKAQIRRYESQPYENPQTGEMEISPVQNDMDALAAFSAQKPMADLAGFLSFDEAGREVFNFGKYKGMPVETVFEKDRGYYDWIMKAEFPLYTKKVLTGIQLRKMGTR